MERGFPVGLIALLGICLIAGCGKGGSKGPAADSSSGASPTTTEAIARAAADFLDAILKGDTQRASARLTPQAIERIIASGIQFQPQGLQSAVFHIGEIRTPSQNQAIVQCVLTDRADDGTEQSEEMCCLMRNVENDWRVSGIAYGKGPNQPWTLSDFETGQTTTISRQPLPTTAGQPTAVRPAAATAGRPSPPRTTNEPPAAVVR
jgi:hypothetical protein